MILFDAWGASAKMDAVMLKNASQAVILNVVVVVSDAVGAC
jgi:hypothetical protein